MNKKFNFIHCLQFVFIVFSAFFIGFMLDFAQTNSLAFSAQIVFKTNFGPYLLTVLILGLIYLGIYGLVNRFFYSTAIFYVFFAIYGVADRLKVQYRAEPILPSDLMFLSNMKELLSMITVKLIVEVVIVLAIIIIGCILLEKYFGQKLLRFKLWPRVAWVLLGVLSIASFYTANEENSLTAKVLDKVGFANYEVNINWSANNNGPMLTFLSSMHVKIMDQPDSYSEATMNKLVTKYQKVANKINKKRPNNNLSKQTLIFVLSESFADPKRVPNVKVNQEVVPKIQQVKKDNTSGLMLSSGYGGGTANMEYMTFTGLAFNQFSKSLQTPYTQLVAKQTKPINIANSFKTTAAIHPFYGNFYARNVVYKKFGIQTFRNIGTTGDLALKYTATEDGGQYVSDESAFKDTLWQLNQTKGGQFINLVTMQNHLPYTTKYAGNQFKVSGTGAGKNNQQVASYAKGISMTDTSVRKFLDKLDQLQKPITVVWYGDHLPGIYDGASMKKNNVVKHETDYFIYSNKYALAHGYGTKKLTANTKYTDPNGFIPLALKQMGQQVTPYSALLTKVQEELPAMAKNSVGSSENLYVNSKGKQVSDNQLTKKQQKLVHDYQLLQYDLTAGNGYSKARINQ